VYSDAKTASLVGFALVVGINLYSNTLLPLRYAAADAASLASLLRSWGVTTRYLLNKDATRKSILEELRSLCNSAKAKGERVIFYFAGHSILANGSVKLCIPTSNVTCEEVDVMEIFLFLHAESASSLVILDACHVRSLIDEVRFTNVNHTVALDLNVTSKETFLVVPTTAGQLQDGIFTPQFLALWRNINYREIITNGVNFLTAVLVTKNYENPPLS